MKIKITLILMIVMLASACLSTRSPSRLSPEEEAYLDAALQQSLRFQVKPEHSNDRWGMAQIFINNYSKLGIQILTDDLIESDPPRGNQLGYKVTRIRGRNEHTFEIVCLYEKKSLAKDAEYNARIFAYYLVTGMVIPDLIKD